MTFPNKTMNMEKHHSLDSVFSCVIPYIHDVDDCNSLSLLSRKLYELDGITRKHITVHVHYLQNPSCLSQRFPNIESLTLIGLLSEFYFPTFKVTLWIIELTVSFKCLNALCIRDMYVGDEDLKLLGSKHGKDIRVLKIRGGSQKGVSNSGLMHVAKYCNQLRKFYFKDKSTETVGLCGNWLRELALHNKVIESLHFNIGANRYAGNALTLLAKNCSKTLASLKIGRCSLSKLGEEAFRHAVRLEDFDGAYFDKHDEAFKFPPNMRCLGIFSLPETSYPFVLPLVNQLRELNLRSTYPNEYKCHCFLIKKCPNLEVLHTMDICGDRGLQLIGQFCKKLRKLTHIGRATHLGLISLVQGCCNLEYLHVILKYITNEALECIGTHLKNLGGLHMILVNKIGKTDLPLDNGIRAMLNGCSKLERPYLPLPRRIDGYGFGLHWKVWS